VENQENIFNNIRKIKGVKHIEERIKFGLILGYKETSKFAIGLAIDLKESILKPEEKLIEGNLEKDGLYLGVNLAKKLKIKTGDELLLATKTSEGGLNAIKLKVKGIFKYKVATLDNDFFILDLNEAKRLLKIKDGTTEILVYTHPEKTEKVKSEIIKILPEGVTVKNIKEQIGNMYQLFEAGRIIYYIIYAIIVLLASFVVVNTMMMNVFERIKEIGTLKALGLTDTEVYLNFIIEGGIIGFIGSVVGGIVGYITNIILNLTGIDFEFVMKEITMPMEYIIRPEANIYVLLVTIVFGVLIPALATMYPAGYAKKLAPAEALRK
ncbi:MAG: FtsX-like permease family protein, partial [Brevinematales bacterium]|nr:FtsX-like permease family protein [Brevinematales bacterium]